MRFSEDTCRERPVEAAREVGVNLANMEFRSMNCKDK